MPRRSSLALAPILAASVMALSPVARGGDAVATRRAWQPDRVRVYEVNQRMDFHNLKEKNRFEVTTEEEHTEVPLLETAGRRLDFLTVGRETRNDLTGLTLKGIPLPAVVARKMFPSTLHTKVRWSEIDRRAAPQDAARGVKADLAQLYLDARLQAEIFRIARTLPNDPISPGGTWAQTETVLGLAVTTRYRFERIVMHAGRGCAHISGQVAARIPEVSTGQRVYTGGAFTWEFDLQDGTLCAFHGRSTLENPTHPQTMEHEESWALRGEKTHPGKEAARWRRAANGIVRALRLREAKQAATALEVLGELETPAGALTAAKETLQADYRAVVDGIRWTRSWDEAVARSKAAGDRPILVVVTQALCPPCAMLERNVLRDAQAIQLVNERFVPLRANFHVDAPWLKTYRLRGTPTCLVLSPRGEKIAEIVGYSPAWQFRRTLEGHAKDWAAKGANRKPTSPTEGGEAF